MPPIPLFTSIPPRVQRVIHGQQDVGAAWTRACITSWQRAGYRVVSVNAHCEVAEIRRQHPDVDVVGVARDGRVRTGRPLVFIADMLALMADCGHTSAAIANADVLCMNDAADRLRGWQPDGFAYSNRVDIDDPQLSNPRLHGGMDFLIANTRHLRTLDVPDFLFGTPWWDYWLPMALTAQGVQGARLAVNNLPLIAHLAHDDRWKSVDLLANFARYAQSLADQARQPGGEPAPAMLDICLRIARSTSTMVHECNPVQELPAAAVQQAALQAG
jgi:hypothetical protein